MQTHFRSRGWRISRFNFTANHAKLTRSLPLARPCGPSPSANSFRRFPKRLNSQTKTSPGAVAGIIFPELDAARR